jgi:hypothetical protein
LSCSWVVSLFFVFGGGLCFVFVMHFLLLIVLFENTIIFLPVMHALLVRFQYFTFRVLVCVCLIIYFFVLKDMLSDQV